MSLAASTVGTSGIDNAFAQRHEYGTGSEIMGSHKCGPPGWAGSEKRHGFAVPGALRNKSVPSESGSPDQPVFSTEMPRMETGCFGASGPSVPPIPLSAIRSTMSIPSVTRPKIE